MPGVKLKWLKIHQYRNVQPGTELRFDDGINLVLGQNGSGKTTLLGLITRVVSTDFSELEEVPFDLEYQLTLDEVHTIVRITNSPSEEIPASSYIYEASITSPAGASSLTVRGTTDDLTITIDGHAKHFPPEPPFRAEFLPNAIDNLIGADSPFPGIADRLYTRLVNKFDESLDCFLAMTGRSPVTQHAGTPAPAWMQLRQHNGRKAFPRSRKFTPLALAPLVPEAQGQPAGEFHIIVDSENQVGALRFLSIAAKLMGAEEATWRPQVVQSDMHPSGKWQTFDVQGSAFTFTRQGNRRISHDLLSYGQKRLLAYYYYLDCTQDFVIADELVNGLHHRWIAACMKAIGDRQAFLTSQNPLLFEHVEFKSIEQVQACFITCKSKLVEGAEQLVWKNMSERDARNFFESYQVGIESPGDILMIRGLW
jgi:energy-coupling factor transporter ATP-binding protein EcfA2